ncbi:hypothetical protein JOC94_004575 [Bacillus thermophilus]|uniref:Uncharacterized protein n=1 Tax=Siminovitchia thermophila TaxID=1245522 RepID=A0ABS2RD17_9BACI|nr:hypothetical protein [Siminovitchia thermophila]MBM7717546.1 hypothetical protein [Siminovitchia thermophila]ONK22340.1 hypothetical protein BLX87_16730 [Bacillus sp. VT-16-64]
MNWWIVAFILFVVTGLVLTVFGWNKTSVLTMFFGISFLMIPIFYAVEWLKPFVPFIPPISIGIAYLSKKKNTA